MSSYDPFINPSSRIQRHCYFQKDLFFWRSKKDEISLVQFNNPWLREKGYWIQLYNGPINYTFRSEVVKSLLNQIRNSDEIFNALNEELSDVFDDDARYSISFEDEVNNVFYEAYYEDGSYGTYQVCVDIYDLEKTNMFNEALLIKSLHYPA